MSKRYLPYLIYLGLSILVVLFSNYTQDFARLVLQFYQFVDTQIAVFFSTSPSGLNLRHVFTLVICPLILTGIPALVYRFTKGGMMPYYLEATWLIWIILVLSKILVR